MRGAASMGMIQRHHIVCLFARFGIDGCMLAPRGMQGQIRSAEGSSFVSVDPEHVVCRTGCLVKLG